MHDRSHRRPDDGRLLRLHARPGRQPADRFQRRHERGRRGRPVRDAADRRDDGDGREAERLRREEPGHRRLRRRPVPALRPRRCGPQPSAARPDPSQAQQPDIEHAAGADDGDGRESAGRACHEADPRVADPLPGAVSAAGRNRERIPDLLCVHGEACGGASVLLRGHGELPGNHTFELQDLPVPGREASRREDRGQHDHDRRRAERRLRVARARQDALQRHGVHVPGVSTTSTTCTRTSTRPSRSIT